MRTQKMHLLTGTMLSLLLSGVSVYPAIARPMGESESGQPISQTDPSQTSPSQTSPSQTSPSQTSPSQTSPGNTIPPDAQTVKGTVKKISGDVVTLQLPDGSTRDITFPEGSVQRLKLKGGTPIAVVLDSQDKPIRVVTINSNTSNSTVTFPANSTRREEEVTTTRRTTTVRTVKPTPTQTQNTAPAPAPAPAPAESSAPVRARW